MSLFVKICGLARARDVEAVAELRPNAIGFVFWKGSPRYVTPEDVAAWTRNWPASVLKVGVFVDASEEEMRAAVARAGLDVVQLHGFQGLGKRPEKFPTFGKNTGPSGARPVLVWGAVRLLEDAEERARAWAGAVDAFLVDSYSARTPGGTGQVVDWDRARAFVERAGRPVILAGGLSPENVEEAVRRVRPWGVDVSSGVEARPGVKDVGRVREFLERCRGL